LNAEPLRTARLVLEPLEARHADAAFAGFADPTLHTYTPSEPPTDVEALRAHFARLSAGSGRPTEDWLNWIVIAQDGGAYVGWMQATVFDDRTASVAYDIFSTHTRRGYAREAAAAMLSWLWSHPTLTLVIAQADVRNVASHRTALALGLRPDFDTVASELRGEPTVDRIYRMQRPTRD
jgi:RimJ/RimL family protein N-acetyltransferase